MASTSISPQAEPSRPTIERPRLSDWVWRPWYAKLWWALSAVYWTAGVGAFVFQPLADFYASGLAGFLNIAFYPVFAFILLSIGWMIAWKDALDLVAEHPEIENTLGWQWAAERDDFHRVRTRRRNDPSNPTSPSFIANSIMHRMFDR